MAPRPPSAAPSWSPWILAWVAATLVLLYWTTVEAPRTDVRMDEHTAILQGTADSPYQYRVLAVGVAEVFIRGGETVLPHRQAFHLAYLLWNLAATTLLLLGQFRLLRRWFEDAPALSGSLLLTPALLLAFGNANYYFMPWSVAEPAFAVWILHAALAGRGGWVALLVGVAALNRETAVLAAFTAAAVAWAPDHGERDDGSRPAWLDSLVPLVVWAAVYGSVRLLRPAADPILQRSEILAANLPPAAVAWAMVLLALFLGPLWMAVGRGWRAAPAPLRRAGLVIVPTLALYLVFGIWREVRILLAALPVLMALALFGVRDRRTSDGGVR